MIVHITSVFNITKVYNYKRLKGKSYKYFITIEKIGKNILVKNKASNLLKGRKERYYF